MSSSLLVEYERLVSVEFGAVYFGNWPLDARHDAPHMFPGHEPPGVAFTGTGVGVYSDCYDDELMQLDIRFYESDPHCEGVKIGSVGGEFFVSSDRLAPATVNLAPVDPLDPPFRGNVGVRVTHVDLGKNDDPAVRDKWNIDIWPILLK
ncbi:hypothetical protein ACL03H_01340 [Saccharopolyspora sp. MS10]|uniref:hypothetical protein n=1 Tax=Saccharopolyspora sp. MS10 TaxID=3385973 RepID=UPI0039A29B86